MENEIPKIGFALRKITTEQFALIEEGFIDNGKIRIGTILKFGADEKSKLIACFSTFTFESNEKVFIIIEAGCHFVIAENTWNEMVEKESGSIKIPKGFSTHLAMLTVGTTRGLLHAKTEGTCYNKYVLPTINVSTLIQDDVIFNFKTPEEKNRPF